MDSAGRCRARSGTATEAGEPQLEVSSFADGRARTAIIDAFLAAQQQARPTRIDYNDHMVNETRRADTDDEARARFVVPALSARGRRSWDSREVQARRQGLAAHLEDSMAQHLAAARTYGQTLARHGRELDETQWHALVHDLEASLSAAMAETRLITNLLRGHGRASGTGRRAQRDPQ